MQTITTANVKGLAELRATFAKLSDRRFTAGIATGLTRTAVLTRGDGQQTMRQVFDRPTPFTINSLRYVGATADKLAAAVGLDIAAITDIQGRVLRYQDLGPGETPAGRYLQAQLKGGARQRKRLEVALAAAGILPDGYFAVPAAGARLDAFGNMQRGQVVQILSQLRLQLVAGTTRNMSGDARKQIAAQRKAGGRFFVVPPGTPNTTPGIYQREFIGRNVTPVMLFVRSVSYRVRGDLPGRLQASAAQHLPREMQRALQEQLERLQARGRG